MIYCGSVCNTPFGLGSCYGGVTSCGLLPSYGSLYGMGAWSGLGTLAGANVACASQVPGTEVVIQPPPSVVTIPGPILSSTTEPAAIAQTTPLGVGYSGLGFQGLSPLYSGGLWGRYGRLGLYGDGLYGGWRGYGQRFLPFSGWGYGACVPCTPCGPC